MWTWTLLPLLLTALVASEDHGEKEPRELEVDPPRIELSSGAKLMGKYSRTRDKRRRIAEYWGVPYTLPPVAQRRFTESEVYDEWEGTLNATTKPSPCLQFSHFGYEILGSEDCLYLNIFTPHVDPALTDNEADDFLSQDEMLPVLVFIHGGGFNFLSGSGKTPRFILDKNVVLVTLNYRLGPLGFFSLGDDSVPGNLGLRDQMTALKWVQKNIKSFGGDPNRVTISGMSAGGASVHYHLLSPLSKGLFQQAISMSGTALDPWAEAEEIKEKSLDMAFKIGCPHSTHENILKCLREKSPEQMISVSVKDQKVWLYNPISPWAPSPELKSSNPFLPDSPINIILNGKANDVPWLVSYSSLEGLYPGGDFVFNATLRDYLDKNWLAVLPHLLEYNYTVPSERKDQISAKIKEHYLKGKLASDENSIRPLIDMISDRMFVVGISEAALRHAKTYKSPVFVYRFSYSGDDSVSNFMCDCEDRIEGACHGDDVAYFLESSVPKITSERDLKLSQSMVEFIYSFVSTGKPIFKEVRVPEVKMFLPTLMYLDIDRLGAPYIVREMDTGNQHFWASLGIKEPAFTSEYNHSHSHEL